MNKFIKNPNSYTTLVTLDELDNKVAVDKICATCSMGDNRLSSKCCDKCMAPGASNWCWNGIMPPTPKIEEAIIKSKVERRCSTCVDDTKPRAEAPCTGCITSGSLVSWRPKQSEVADNAISCDTCLYSAGDTVCSRCDASFSHWKAKEDHHVSEGNDTGVALHPEVQEPMYLRTPCDSCKHYIPDAMNDPICKKCVTVEGMSSHWEAAKSITQVISVPTILTQRGTEYGSFVDKCGFIWKTKHLMNNCPSWELMDVDAKEAAHMIVHKLSRLLYGDSKKVDSWQDIAGYATLVADRYAKQEKEGE